MCLRELGDEMQLQIINWCSLLANFKTVSQNAMTFTFCMRSEVVSYSDYKCQSSTL